MASVIPAMPDARRTIAGKLHSPAPPPLSAARPHRTRAALRASRQVVGAAILAAAIFLMGAWAGPHIIGHLLGVGDADHCLVCAAMHGIRGGTPTTIAVSVPALPFVGLSALQHQPLVPAVSLASPSLRGPPVIG